MLPKEGDREQRESKTQVTRSQPSMFGGSKAGRFTGGPLISRLEQVQISLQVLDLTYFRSFFPGWRSLSSTL